MKGGAVFIEQMFHIDLHLALLIFTLIVAAYVITGGIKGVLYTDALQAVIMFACMLFLLFWFTKSWTWASLSEPETDGDCTGSRPFQRVGTPVMDGAPGHRSPQWYTWSHRLS